MVQRHWNRRISDIMGQFLSQIAVAWADVMSMPIHRFLQNMPIGPEEISRLTTAYEQALRGIGLVDRDDPLSEMVAKKVIQIAKSGVRDPTDIAALAIMELGTH
jgi:hypothetical protein